MPLATLNWKLVGTQTLVAPGIAACLDAIHTLGTATTYPDGSTRTPGSGSAWTWTRQQIGGITEACFGAMPYTNAENIRFVVGGSATARTYTLLSPDTTSSLTNALLFAMNRGATTVTGNWYDANGAYGSGSSGFWRGGRPFTTIGFDKITMYENQEEVTILLSRASDGATGACGMWSLDPKDTAASAQESSGRRWMMWGTGSQANPSVTFLQDYFTTTSTGYITHSTSNAYGHCGIFLIGSNTITAVSRTVGPLGASAFPIGWQTTGGKLPIVQDVVIGGANGAAAGVWRAAAYTRQAVGLTTWVDGATVKGYYLGTSTTTATQGLLLLTNN
jgi:hypothetical protein